MLTGVLNHALLASFESPSVSCSRVSSSCVLPLNVIEPADELNPLPKLMPVPDPMVYVALACGLRLNPGDVAIALMVSDWLTVTVAEPLNGVDDVEAGPLIA